MDAFEPIFDRLRSRPEAFFVGQRSESLVDQAEKSLGMSFPESYRAFLLEFGCGDLGGEEIFGVVDSDFEHSSVPDAVWVTAYARREFGLDPRYLIIGQVGDGRSYALDTAQLFNGECPVVLLSVESSPLDEVASSFAAFLVELLDELDGEQR